MNKKRRSDKDRTTIKFALRRVKDKSLAQEIQITQPTDSPESRKAVALVARINKATRSPQQVMNSAVIEDLASLDDWTRPKLVIRKVNAKTVAPVERLIYPEYIKARAIANDKDFFEQLGRAIYEDRGGSSRRKLKLFLLENWDRLSCPDGSTVVGLKFFTDEAVTAFVEIALPDYVPPSLGAYRETRKSLGLSPSKSPQVRHVYRKGDQIALDPE